MLDLGISKMALIGAVALIVIGPEKLPRVARTVGTLLGKAQRYVADVKSEVNRAMDLDELKKMKESVESAGREVEQSIHATQSAFEKDWNEATAGLGGTGTGEDAPIPSWSRRRRNTDAPTRTGASSAAPRRSGTSSATACAGRCSRARRAWRAIAPRVHDP